MTSSFRQLPPGSRLKPTNIDNRKGLKCLMLHAMVWTMYLLIIEVVILPTAAARELRPWTTADSAEVRYVPMDPYTRDLHYIRPEQSRIERGRLPDIQTNAVVPSPSGHNFFVLEHHGDLQQQSTNWTLSIYDSEVTRGLVYRHESSIPNNAAIARISGAVNIHRRFQAGIYKPIWTGDGRTLYFLKGTPDGLQVHRYDTVAGQLTQLTNHPNGVLEFAAQGEMVFYQGAPDEVDLKLAPQGRYPIDFSHRNPMDGAVTKSVIEPKNKRSLTGYFVVGGGNYRPQSVILPALSSGAPPNFIMSPDGRMIVVKSGQEIVVTKFGSNQELIEIERVRFNKDLISIKTFRETAAPEGRPNATLKAPIFWSSDSKHLFVVGANKTDADQAYAFGVYHVSNRTWDWHESVLDGALISGLHWSESRGELLIEWRDGRRSGYRFVGGEAQQVGDISAMVHAFANPLGDLKVRVEEDQNTPPRVIASVYNHEAVISEVDPALVGVEHLPVRTFKWLDPDGSEMEGGLVLPAGWKPGERVPVLINPYHFIPERWLPDGVNVSSDAAQALAARGIAVLLVDTPKDATPNQKLDKDGRSDPAEGSYFVRRLDAIVDRLVSDGFTSPEQIALSGFSRGGYNVYYATAHPSRTAVAATMANDNFMGHQYSSLLEHGATFDRDYVIQMHEAIKRDPWQDPSYWLVEDSTLNADRVRTPTLFSFIFGLLPPGSEGTALSVIGAYRLNGIPIDTVHVPDEDHGLFYPMSRVALQSAAVDWFAFWLLGEEDPEPSKFAQYKRWRQYRIDWQATQAKEIARGEPGFLKSRSGLMYKITDRKVGNAPDQGDAISIRYTLKVADDSAKAIGPVLVRLADTPVPDPRFAALPGYRMVQKVDGLDECLRYLHPGEKATCLMPASIAPEGAAPGAKPDAVVRYEVEIIDITSKGDAAVNAAQLH